MTYCLALKLRDGLVFASDSRTTAGVDYISTYSKMHVFQPRADRLHRRAHLGQSRHHPGGARQPAARSGRRRCRSRASARCRTVRGGTLYRQSAVHASCSQYAHALKSSGADARATLIVGGQITGADPELYLVYPEGNYVAATHETPFLQLGEFKYGKPILSRIAGGGPVAR